MNRPRDKSSIALLRHAAAARGGVVRLRAGVCAAVLLTWLAGCSSLAPCRDCVMPVDEHGYSPMTPYGFYDTHWNVWPTECEEGEEVPAAKGKGPATETLPEPSQDSQVPPLPGGRTPGNIEDTLQLPEETPKAVPPSGPAPGAPMTPGQLPALPMTPAPMTPGQTPGEPMPPDSTPPATNPLEEPAKSFTPPSTLPALPKPDELKPGELPESLLPKEPQGTPKKDDEKKGKPGDTPKQSRLRQRELSGPRLPASRGSGTPDLEFPENRIRKTSAAGTPAVKSTSDGSGWRAKGGGAKSQPDESAGAWQGRRTTAQSANRQASHVESTEAPNAVKPAGGASTGGNPLR